MENPDVVYLGYEETCVDEASDDRHCLDEHYELGELKGSILFGGKHLEIGNHNSISYCIPYTQHQHPKVPLKFIIRVVGELNFEVNSVYDLQVIRSPF